MAADPVPAAAVTTTTLPASRPWPPTLPGGVDGDHQPLASRGRPSTRSAMMLRCISLEPP